MHVPLDASVKQKAASFRRASSLDLESTASRHGVAQTPRVAPPGPQMLDGASQTQASWELPMERTLGSPSKRRGSAVSERHILWLQ